MPNDGLILAFDIGTSSLRTALFDIEAKRISASTVQRQYQLTSDADGKAELNPQQLLRATEDCLGETLAVQSADQALARLPILAVGASCFWHSLLGVDVDGNPLTPIYTWADARCAKDAEALREQFDERAVHEATGCMLRPSFWPAKLVWLRRTQPKLFASVRYWLSPAEWLYWQLAGVRACAIGMVTGTGLYNPKALDWEDSLLHVCRLERDRLLPLSDDAQAVQAMRLQWPALAQAAWFAGIGDGAASNLGSGATRDGLAALNFGTSAAIRVLRSGRDAIAPFGLFAYRVDKQRFLLGGAVSNAGNLHAWCLREFKLPDDPAVIEQALMLRRSPDHGLLVLPFWTAERAPTWRDDMRGCIHGLHKSISALDILQATQEAVFYRLVQIAEMIPGDRTLQIIVSGGLNKSPSGLRRLADVFGQPISVCGEAEASIRGAAVSVLERLGYEVPAAPIASVVEFDSAIAERYRAERQRQQQLEQLLY